MHDNCRDFKLTRRNMMIPQEMQGRMKKYFNWYRVRTCIEHKPMRQTLLYTQHKTDHLLSQSYNDDHDYVHCDQKVMHHCHAWFLNYQVHYSRVLLNCPWKCTCFVKAEVLERFFTTKNSDARENMQEMNAPRPHGCWYYSIGAGVPV